MKRHHLLPLRRSAAVRRPRLALRRRRSRTSPSRAAPRRAPACSSRPKGKGPFPAVVVIQEWWGLNDWVKDQARALAKEGYVALAVDLYHGKVADKQEDAHQLMMRAQLRRRRARPEGRPFAYLQSRADVRKGRIGAIGWCMGGMYALSSPPRSRG